MMQATAAPQRKAGQESQPEAEEASETVEVSGCIAENDTTSRQFEQTDKCSRTRTLSALLRDLSTNAVSKFGSGWSLSSAIACSR
jgi:hypothetical protein